MRRLQAGERLSRRRRRLLGGADFAARRARPAPPGERVARRKAAAGLETRLRPVGSRDADHDASEFVAERLGAGAGRAPILEAGSARPLPRRGPRAPFSQRESPCAGAGGRRARAVDDIDDCGTSRLDSVARLDVDAREGRRCEPRARGSTPPRPRAAARRPGRLPLCGDARKPRSMSDRARAAARALRERSTRRAGAGALDDVERATRRRSAARRAESCRPRQPAGAVAAAETARAAERAEAPP